MAMFVEYNGELVTLHVKGRRPLVLTEEDAMELWRHLTDLFRSTLEDADHGGGAGPGLRSALDGLRLPGEL